MKQVLQNRSTGKASALEVPIPALQRGRVLVRTAASLISAGTERAAVELARKSLVKEARDRPDLIKTVIDKARREGVLGTLNAVRDKLSSSQALGYSAAGTVAAVAPDVTEFQVGDLVACAGVGFASHAEVIAVPRNLCVRLPDSLDFEAGAFGTLGAIALQGVRLAEPTIGEAMVVIGLGLVGQLTVQLLRANGCRVFGIDLDPSRVALASELGADAGSLPDEDVRRSVRTWTRGRGVDGVLITAASDSNQPLELAGDISRLKGRVVVVGMTGLEVPRQSFYTRELALKISMSYGPGRYDPEYEERGRDYPFAYVRWTENRNIEAFLDLVADGRVDVKPLISHRFPLANAEQAYQLIAGDLNEPYLGVLLTYDGVREPGRSIQITKQATASKPAKSVALGVIGAGNYVSAMLLPHFKANGARMHVIMNASGVSAHDVGRKFGFTRAVSSAEEIIVDEEVNLVAIGTPHDLHATLAQRALEHGLHVFVEKPLALNDEELDKLVAAAQESAGRLMVGFNRRFSPLASEGKEFFVGRREPLSIFYRVNAGRVPREHWGQDPERGGGRIIGEVCHFVDLMQFWTDAKPVSVFAEGLLTRNREIVPEDSVFITLQFADGSNGCIAYLAEGDSSLPKERVEIFGEGKTFVLEDFISASFHKNGRAHKTKLRTQNKGQAEEVRRICKVVLEGGPPPIPLDELAATTRATFRIRDALRERRPQTIAD